MSRRKECIRVHVSYEVSATYEFSVEDADKAEELALAKAKEEKLHERPAKYRVAFSEHFVSLAPTKDLEDVIVLKDESVKKCPRCGVKLEITADDGYLVRTTSNVTAMAECEDEIFYLPCCGAEATFNATGTWEG
jgi:hypothetical protein